MVVAAGFEPAIAWMKTMCPRPLDDATIVRHIITRESRNCKSKSIRYDKKYVRMVGRDKT